MHKHNTNPQTLNPKPLNPIPLNPNRVSFALRVSVVELFPWASERGMLRAATTATTPTPPPPPPPPPAAAAAAAAATTITTTTAGTTKTTTVVVVVVLLLLLPQPMYKQPLTRSSRIQPQILQLRPRHCDLRHGVDARVPGKVTKVSPCPENGLMALGLSWGIPCGFQSIFGLGVSGFLAVSHPLKPQQQSHSTAQGTSRTLSPVCRFRASLCLPR